MINMCFGLNYSYSCFNLIDVVQTINITKQSINVRVKNSLFFHLTLASHSFKLATKRPDKSRLVFCLPDYVTRIILLGILATHGY